MSKWRMMYYVISLIIVPPFKNQHNCQPHNLLYKTINVIKVRPGRFRTKCVEEHFTGEQAVGTA